MYSDEEFDKAKTRVLKYIMYKKRTQNEILTKFKDIDENMLENIIEYLKELNYINDEEYIEKSIDEYKRLNNLSIKELKYKLMAKGLKRDLIEEYIDKNIENLIEYEKQSAQNIITKKSRALEETEIKQYLLKKGYNLEGLFD